MDDNTTPRTHDDAAPEDLLVEDSVTGDDVDVDRDYVEEAVASVDGSTDDPREQLRGLVEWLVYQLVDEPDNVTVDAAQRGSAVQVQVRLPEADLGKVIGRGGRIAKSIRTALMIVGSRHHMRVSLDIEGQD